MFKCLTNKDIDLNSFIQGIDILESAASDRIILESLFEKYICKYGNSTSEMNNVAISYTNSPLSEYITCKAIKAILNETFKNMKNTIQEVELGLNTENNKLFVMCKYYESNRLISLFNICKMADIQLWDIKISYNKAREALNKADKLVYNNWYNAKEVLIRQYDIYLLLSYIFGNGDLHAKNYSLKYSENADGTFGAFWYDFGASLKNKLSDTQCEKYIQLSRDERLKRISNERFNYVDDTGKEVSILKYIKDFNKKDVDRILNLDINKIIVDIVDNLECISDIRKSFYKIYISDRLWFLTDYIIKPDSLKAVDMLNNVRS